MQLKEHASLNLHARQVEALNRPLKSRLCE